MSIVVSPKPALNNPVTSFLSNKDNVSSIFKIRQIKGW